MEIGSKLKEARQNSGYTQEQIAQHLGVSRQSVSGWENDRAYPELSYVIKLSELYHLSLDELLRDKSAYVAFVEKSTRKPKVKVTLTMVLEIALFLLIWGGFVASYYFTFPNSPYGDEAVYGDTALGYVVLVYVFLYPQVIVLFSGLIGADPGWERLKWFLIPVIAFSAQLMNMVTFGSEYSVFGHGFFEMFISLTLPASILSFGGMLIGNVIGRAVAKARRRKQDGIREQAPTGADTK